MEVARLSAITRGRTRTFVLRPGTVTTLGRSSRCTVPLRDRKVSRVHCQLTFDQWHVVAVDLDSRHGLLHRGERQPLLALPPGDGFHLGETFVRFVAVDQVDDATVAAWFAPDGIYAPRPIDAAEADADEAEDAENAENDADESVPPASPTAVPMRMPAAPSAPRPADDRLPVAVGPSRGDQAPPASPALPSVVADDAGRSGFAATDYPDVEPEILRPQPLPRRREATARKAFAARLAAEAIVFSIHMAFCLALLLTLRVAGFDIYRVFGFTQP